MPVRLRAALSAGIIVAASILATATTVTPVAAAGEKVAIIVGPVGGMTNGYRNAADGVANAAVAAGATVAAVYSPNATWANVQAAVNGANVIVYFGHGNGFPNPYGEHRAHGPHERLGPQPHDHQRRRRQLVDDAGVLRREGAPGHPDRQRRCRSAHLLRRRRHLARPGLHDDLRTGPLHRWLGRALLAVRSAHDPGRGAAAGPKLQLSRAGARRPGLLRDRPRRRRRDPDPRPDPAEQHHGPDLLPGRWLQPERPDGHLARRHPRRRGLGPGDRRGLDALRPARLLVRLRRQPERARRRPAAPPRRRSRSATSPARPSSRTSRGSRHRASRSAVATGSTARRRT